MSDVNLERLHSLSDGELYAELGRHMTGTGELGMGGISPARLKRIGKEKWDDSQRLLRQHLCTDDGLTRFGDTETAVTQGLVAAVCEALQFGMAEAAIVSVLLLRNGLDKLCR